MEKIWELPFMIMSTSCFWLRGFCEAFKMRLTMFVQFLTCASHRFSSRWWMIDTRYHHLNLVTYLIMPCLHPQLVGSINHGPFPFPFPTLRRIGTTSRPGCDKSRAARSRGINFCGANKPNEAGKTMAGRHGKKQQQFLVEVRTKNSWTAIMFGSSFSFRISQIGSLV